MVVVVTEAMPLTEAMRVTRAEAVTWAVAVGAMAAEDGALALALATLLTMAAIMLRRLPTTATATQRLLMWGLATPPTQELFGLGRDGTAAATTQDIGADANETSSSD